MGKYGDCYACIKCRLAMIEYEISHCSICYFRITILYTLSTSEKRCTFGMMDCCHPEGVLLKRYEGLTPPCKSLSRRRESKMQKKDEILIKL